MKSRRKTPHLLGLLTRDAGYAQAHYKADRTAGNLPTIEADTYYVQLDIDDPDEPDRYAAVNLSIEQAEHVITNLSRAVMAAKDGEARLANTRAKDAARQAALTRWVERSQHGDPVRVTLGTPE